MARLLPVVPTYVLLDRLVVHRCFNVVMSGGLQLGMDLDMNSELNPMTPCACSLARTSTNHQLHYFL